MSEDEMMADLKKICKNCGEFKGRHKAYDLNCPEIEDGRTIAYKKQISFSEWKEEKEANDVQA